jgi:hypothetical protein
MISIINATPATVEMIAFILIDKKHPLRFQADALTKQELTRMDRMMMKATLSFIVHHLISILSILVNSFLPHLSTVLVSD